MNNIKKMTYIPVLIIISIFICNILVYTFFLDWYYLYSNKSTLSKAMTEFLTTEQIPTALEKKYNLTIVESINTDDLDQLNSNLSYKLSSKGIHLNKFWISSEKLDLLEKNNSVGVIFNQGKEKSSFLARLGIIDKRIVLMGISLSHTDDTLKLVGLINLCFTGIGVFISIIYLTSFSRKLDKSQRELKSKNENLKLFIDNISHEMKTPVSVISAYSQGLKDGLDDGSFSDILLSASSNIDSLLKNLLELSSLRENDVKADCLDLKLILEEILSDLSFFIEDKEKNIAFNIEGDSHILLDEKSIEIILKNLILNAIKYSDSNEIDISTKRIDKNVIFSISNKAIFSKEVESNLNHIWDPFFVLDKARSKEVSGTGLGLSLVKKVVENYKLKHEVLYDAELNLITFVIEFNLCIK